MTIVAYTVNETTVIGPECFLDCRLCAESGKRSRAVLHVNMSRRYVPTGKRKERIDAQGMFLCENHARNYGLLR